MGSRRRTSWCSAALALVLGCYRPSPPEGAPCNAADECPSPLRCDRGFCRAGTSPDLDAPPSQVDGPTAYDAAPDGTTAGVCPAFAAHCDNFEAGDLTAWTGTALSAGASVAPSNLQARSGVLALEAIVPAMPSSGSSGYVYRRSALQSTGTLAARAWIYSPQPIIKYDGVIRLGRNGAYALVAGDDDGHWTVSEGSTAGLYDHHSTTSAQLQQWTCIEINYTFEPARIRLFADDVLVLDASAHDPQPGYTDVAVGVTRAESGGYRVFIDDVVIADQHIGCQ